MLRLSPEPPQMLEALCSLKGRYFTLHDFKKRMEGVIGDTVNDKTAEAFFFYPKHMHLVEDEGRREYSERIYRIGEIGARLCLLRSDPQQKREYTALLASAILSSHRLGPVFKRFLESVGPREQRDMDLYKQFSEVTGKALILWSLEADLVIKHGPFIRATNRVGPRIVTLKKFWDELNNVYRERQASYIPGIRRYFVSIADLRPRLSCRLKFRDPKDFDRYLTRTMKSEYGKRVMLHGGPAHLFDEVDNVFTYGGKAYVLISIPRQVDGKGIR